VKGRHIGGPGVEENEIRQDRHERLVQVHNVELLTAKERLDGVIERYVEGDANSAAVCGDRYGAPDPIKAVTHFETAAAPTWGEDDDIVPTPQELGTQVRDVLEDTAGVSSVIG
jgi:hypothetical protein